MDKKKGKKSSASDSQDIEATGDSIIISESLSHIGEGLFAIARAIERLAESQYGEEEPQEQLTYMDGKRI